MAVVSLIIFVFAEPLVHYIISPNLTPQQLHNTVTIMRFLALNPLLFTISGVLTATQQTMGRFFFYAVAPLAYNLSIIASIYVFKHNIGLVGLGIGALVGAVLQLGIVSLGLFNTGFHWSSKIVWRNSDFHKILKNLPPRSLDQGIDQVEDIIQTHFARRLGTGYISYTITPIHVYSSNFSDWYSDINGRFPPNEQSSSPRPTRSIPQRIFKNFTGHDLGGCPSIDN